jgi:PAS domain S-box-containing protein
MAIIHDIQIVTSDLIGLAAHVEQYCLDGGGEYHHLEELAKEFLEFSKRKGVHDQIRLMSNSGKEIVRINFNNGQPAIVPPDSLQGKRWRYYFDEIMALAPGKVYISQLDLNIERGQIEWPLKPMIRFGTPVADSRAQKRGLIVLNYFGRELFQHLEQTIFDTARYLALLDADGYWLKGPGPEYEWGFMFEARKHLKFSTQFPEVWEYLSNIQNGQIRTKDGLFTFTTVYPRLEGLEAGVGSWRSIDIGEEAINTNQYFWKVVSQVPSESLHAEVSGLQLKYLLLLLFLVISTSIIAWYLSRAKAGRQEADEALRENEERFRNTLDSMLEGCQIIGFDWRYLYVNNSIARHGRRTKAELLGHTMMEVYHGIENTKMFATLRRCMEKRTTHRLENEFAYPDGSKGWFDLSIQPVTEGIFIVSMDITESKLSEEAMRKLTHVVEQSADYVVITDKEGVIEYVNPAFVEHTGYTQEEAVGKKPSILKSSKHDQRFYMELWETILAGKPFHGEVINQKKNGTLYYEEKTITPLRDAEGNITHFVSSAIDITARKEAEEELGRYRDHLEELVEERTAQLEAANKELEAFSYSVSHDLRTPLRAIDGFGAALLEDHGQQVDEEGRRLIGIMRKNAMQMGQLIDDLLTFSRLGRQKMKASRIDMTALARAVFTELKATAPKQLEMKIGKLPSAKGDRLLLYHVFQNLIDNAIKYSRLEKAPVVELEGRTEDSEHIYTVRDNGVGFDMKYADKLFAVFQRLHRADEFEGTGVGLALVQRIVARHGGRVWAEAAVDRGATFHFTLPAKEAQ